MAGEIDLMLCEPTACGDPWHGLCRSGSLQISESVFKQVVNPPDGGDCVVFRIPGLPEITQSADDISKGMKWLNYAILSGKNRRLYGFNLGFSSWLYLDDAGVVWKASASFSGQSVTVDFVNINDTSLIGSASASLSPSLLLAMNAYGVVDSSSNGRRSIVSFAQDSMRNVASAFGEIRISGLGSAPSIQFLLLSDQNHAGYDSFSVSEDTYIRNYHRTALFTDPNPPHSSTTVNWDFSLTMADLIAGTPAPWPTSPGSPYTVWDPSSDVFISEEENGVYQTDSIVGWVYGADDVAAPVIFRSRNEYFALKVFFTKNTTTGTWDIASTTGSLSISRNVIVAGQVGAVVVNTWSSEGGIMVPAPTNIPDQYPYRYTNRVFGLGAFVSGSTFVHSNPTCPTSTISGNYYGQPSCSYNPATNEFSVVESGSGEVCYI